MREARTRSARKGRVLVWGREHAAAGGRADMVTVHTCVCGAFGRERFELRSPTKVRYWLLLCGAIVPYSTVHDYHMRPLE